MSRVAQVNPNNKLCSVLHAVCLVPVATLCVMLSLMLCCPARALGYTTPVARGGSGAKAPPLAARPIDTLTMDTYAYNCTNIDTYADIHPIIVEARVLALTHMAKDCFEDVLRVVVIIVTLYVIVHTSMGNIMINTITIFAVDAVTTSSILKEEKG